MTKDLEAFGFSEFSAKTVDPDSPVYPPLMSQMKVDIAVSPDADVWIIHEKALPEALKWVEYDPDLETLTLVSLSGKQQDSGMKVPKSVKKYMARAKLVSVVHQGDDFINDMCVVPLLARTSMN